MFVRLFCHTSTLFLFSFLPYFSTYKNIVYSTSCFTFFFSLFNIILQACICKVPTITYKQEFQLIWLSIIIPKYLISDSCFKCTLIILISRIRISLFWKGWKTTKFDFSIRYKERAYLRKTNGPSTEQSLGEHHSFLPGFLLSFVFFIFVLLSFLHSFLSPFLIYFPSPLCTLPYIFSPFSVCVNISALPPFRHSFVSSFPVCCSDRVAFFQATRISFW